MRTAITIGVLHGSGKTELIHGENIPLREQLASFKKSALYETDEKYSELKIFTSDEGIVKRSKFQTKIQQVKLESVKAETEAKHKKQKASKFDL